MLQLYTQVTITETCIFMLPNIMTSFSLFVAAYRKRNERYA